MECKQCEYKADQISKLEGLLENLQDDNAEKDVRIKQLEADLKPATFLPNCKWQETEAIGNTVFCCNIKSKYLRKPCSKRCTESEK